MPAIGSTFQSNEPLLHEILDQIHRGQIQLPDFQRGWVWDDAHIRSLIASVSLSYPIGAVMLLEMGGDGVRFKPRLVEGVKLSPPRNPDRLILDGQQRLTSLYLALRSSEPVPTQTEKGQKIQRFYYLDMRKCLDSEADRMEAVVGVPPDRIIRSDFARQIDLDLSAQKREFENDMLPLGLMLDSPRFFEWRSGYQEFNEYAPERTRFLDRFQQEIWQRFQQYKIPVIELLRGTEKEAVCQVFEKVNTGGVTLSVFELVTATFAASDFSLREDWFGDDEKGIEGRIHRLKTEQLKPLWGIDAVSFLTAVTLLATYKRHLTATADSRPPVSCKRRDVLRLALDEYNQYANSVEKGLKNAARFLTREKVFDQSSLPYATQLIPLATICAFLEDRFEQDSVREKLARWYWCGVFGELYGGANETRFAQDLPDVINWIDGGNPPRTVVDSSFSPIRLLTLQTRNSAAYKGLIVRLMQAGSMDFLSGDAIDLTTYFDGAVDIHHIFPRAWCEKNNVPRSRYDCVVNKAPLTSRTNRVIGGRSPRTYLSSLEGNKGVTRERLDDILGSHRIDPVAVRQDDFHGFFRLRAMALLDLIEEATGKPMSGRDSDEVVEAFGGPLKPGLEGSSEPLPG